MEGEGGVSSTAGHLAPRIADHEEEARLGWWRCRMNLRPLVCKSWADRVPQCAHGVPPREIFGGGLKSSAVVPRSLLHTAAVPVEHLGVNADCPSVRVPGSVIACR
jgi:hypothetical protein